MAYDSAKYTHLHIHTQTGLQKQAIMQPQLSKSEAGPQSRHVLLITLGNDEQSIWTL